MKKKKKSKVIHHELPDPSRLHLDETAPSDQAIQVDDHQASAPKDNAGQPSAASSSLPQTKSSQQDSDSFTGYQVSDSEEFRNVWGHK